MLGPSTQKQADKSRAAVDADDLGDSRSRAAASGGVNGRSDGGVSGAADGGAWESDGGGEPVERNNGLDVVR